MLCLALVYCLFLANRENIILHKTHKLHFCQSRWRESTFVPNHMFLLTNSHSRISDSRLVSDESKSESCNI